MTMLLDLTFSLTLIDAPADLCSALMSVASFLVCKRLEFIIILFFGAVIGPFSVIVIDGLTGEMDGIRIDMLTEVSIAGMVVVVSSAVGVAPAL